MEFDSKTIGGSVSFVACGYMQRRSFALSSPSVNAPPPPPPPQPTISPKTRDDDTIKRSYVLEYSQRWKMTRREMVYASKLTDYIPPNHERTALRELNCWLRGEYTACPKQVIADCLYSWARQKDSRVSLGFETDSTAVFLPQPVVPARHLTGEPLQVEEEEEEEEDFEDQHSLSSFADYTDIKWVSPPKRFFMDDLAHFIDED